MLPPPPGLQLLVNGANSLSRTANRKETSNARVSARKIRLHAHHDALEFPDGKTVLLTQLSEGQHATVLQLPVPSSVAVHDTERKAALVE